MEANFEAVVDQSMKHDFCLAPTGNAHDLSGWVQEAQPGSSTIYFVGFLAIARDPDRRVFGDRTEEIDELGSAALRMRREGKIILLQKRLAEGCFAYIARRK